MKLSLFVAILLSAVIIMFALQNSQSIQIRFLGWYLEGPLVLVLLGVFAVGALAMFLMALPSRFSRRQELAALKRDYDKLRGELKRQEVSQSSVLVSTTVSAAGEGKGAL